MAMAMPEWAPKKKKGESKSAYQKRFYSAQRDHAEETGDQSTTDKIYGKLGKQSHSVDEDKFNKPIRAYGQAAAAIAPFLLGGGLGRGVSGVAASKLPAVISKASKIAPSVARGSRATVKVIPNASKAVSSGSRKALAPAQRALTSAARPKVKVAETIIKVPKTSAMKAAPKVVKNAESTLASSLKKAAAAKGPTKVVRESKMPRTTMGSPRKQPSAAQVKKAETSLLRAIKKPKAAS